jgi:hypothetical protein
LASVGEKSLRATEWSSASYRRSSYRRSVGTVAATVLLLAALIPTAADASDTSSVTPFLLRPGETGGFEPGKVQIFRTVSEVRNAAGESPSKSQVRRYETEGFVEAAIVRIHDQAEPAARGISTVFAFKTPADARAEMKAEREEDLGPAAIRADGVGRYFILRHFKVPGVPNAVAFVFLPSRASTLLGVESGIAKGIFVEGSCLIGVAVFRPASTEVADPVSNGVQAIAGRIGDACP